jgi:hypothetical protein
MALNFRIYRVVQKLNLKKGDENPMITTYDIQLKKENIQAFPTIKKMMGVLYSWIISETHIGVKLDDSERPIGLTVKEIKNLEYVHSINIAK